MNAQVKLGLLQREGCTAIRVTGWPPKSKPQEGENVVGDTAASREAVRRGPCEGTRKGLDDDPARHDEAGALKFMERVRNTAARFPSRDDVLLPLAATWTALGPNRELYREHLRDWYMAYEGNEPEELDKILDSFNRNGTNLGIDYLNMFPEMHPPEEAFPDDPPPEYVDDAPPVAPPAAEDDVFSDDALALWFAELHAEDVRFAALWGKWFEWSASHWRPDEKLHVVSLARQVCRQVAQEVRDDGLKAQLLSASTIASVVRLARSDERLAVATDEFDHDPWLLNTPGGTVDLKTGRMRKHRRLDYITKVTAVSPGGTCPQWEAFIDRITGHDPELAAFIQRMLGYALTGSTQEQCLFFLFGRGANGKSVLLNTVSSILADYHTTAPIETFTTSGTDRHPTELAGLRGARLVTAIETEEGRRWAEAKIKNLTGGDKIAARFMRQDFFEFIPQFKLIIAGNHKPGLLTVDEAIRRRFHLVPFAVTIPPEERDQNLTDKLKAEWPGILQWVIDGCLAWQRDGLKPPAAVRDATREYLEAEDALATWMADCCTRDPDAWESRTALFMSWCGWAKSAGEPIGSQRAFVHKLEERLKPHRTASGRGFKGLKIKENDTW
jgi:putative DNA primase/helicase